VCDILQKAHVLDPSRSMKRPVAALLVVIGGLALLGGLRLAVPHMFIGADSTEAEPASHDTSSRATHSPFAIEVSEPALREAVDPLLYAGAGRHSSAASENEPSMKWPRERDDPLRAFGDQPDVSSLAATKPGFARGGDASGPGSFGTDYLWGASGGMNPNGMGSRSGGNHSGAPSSLATDRSSTALGVDDLQALLALPGSDMSGELPAESGISVPQVESATSASSIPVSEPPMHVLVLSVLTVLWSIRSRSARATSRAA
jgi:hypothetical protein